MTSDETEPSGDGSEGGDGDGEADWLADYTPAERELLRTMIGSRGEEYAEENAGLILAQARLVGDL